MPKLQLVIGAIAPEFHHQLKCDAPAVALEQRMSDAITLLSIHEVISEKERDRARNRLIKRLAKRIRRGEIFVQLPKEEDK